MIREAAQNTIFHIKDLLNKKNKIIQIYKMKLIEVKQNMGQVNYGYCIKYGCQNNQYESIHTIEKLKEAPEKVEFKYEYHVELRMELV